MRILFLAMVLLASCYKMRPEEDEMRTVPTTNNPQLVPGPQRSNPMPAMPY